MTAVRRMRPLLGTYVEVGVAVMTRDDAHAAMEEAFAAMTEIHERLSFHSATSELTRLNQAGGRVTALHPLSVHVLRLARGLMRVSEGRFDCTLGGVLVAAGALPDHGGHALDRGTADDIELWSRAGRLRRPIRVTLDGIAKGYAVDRAVRALRRAGVTAGWVNAGGDLRVFGETVLPVSRRGADGRVRSLGGLRSAAMASSCTGDAHQADFPGCLLAGERRSLQSGVWTVLARTAWRADALTKVAAQLPTTDRARGVARLGGRWVA
jgi:thiamine biosynthesis lipoprotein